MEKVMGKAEKLFALGYTDLVSIIPPGARLLPSSKIPEAALGKIPGKYHPSADAWGGYDWRSVPPEPALLDEWGAGIGFQARSFPAIDIDADDATLAVIAQNVADEALGHAPVRLSTGDRRLLVYAVEPGQRLTKRKLTVKGLGAVELLATGQQYVVDGTHPSGAKYRFQKNRRLPANPLDLPIIGAEEVNAFFETLAGHLRERGYEVSDSETRTGQPAGELEEEYTEGGRSDALVSLGGSLRRRGADGATILAALTAFNENRCVPPLDAVEVESITFSVLRYEPGSTIPDRAPSVQEAFGEPAPAPAPKKAPRPEDVFDMYTGPELARLEIPEQEWLVEGLIPREESTLLIAKPKTGKSTFARALAVAVSQGRGFLGRETQHGPVLYLSTPNEGSKGEAKREFLKLGMTEEESWEALHFFRVKPTVQRDDMFAALETWAAKARPILIIVDTLQGLVRAKDLNDYSTVTAALLPLQEIAHASGAHIMYLHHEPKGERSEYADPIEAALGSTAIGGSVDASLRISRDANESAIRYLAVRGREGIEVPPHVLDLDPDTHWPSLGVESASYRSSKDQIRVMSVFDDLGEDTLTKPQLRAESGMGQNELTNALQALVKQGALTREGAGPSTRYTITTTKVFQGGKVAEEE